MVQPDNASFPDPQRHRQTPSWRTDAGVTRLLGEHLARLKTTDDEDLRREMSRFLYLLFNHRATRPAALQLRRLGRPSIERFLEHQAAILEELKPLARELFLLSPHGAVGRQDACRDGQCRQHALELEGILRTPHAADLELEGARVVRWPPAMRAVACLRHCAQVHKQARIHDAASALWLRHKNACWERVERRRICPARSLDLLLSWIGSSGHLSSEEARHHTNRVAAELLAISASFSRTQRLVDRFRASCELDADELRSTSRRRGIETGGESFTALAIGYFADYDTAAWPIGARRPVQKGIGRPLAITTIMHGACDPLAKLLDGVCRTHALLCRSDEPLGEVLVLLLRVAGPVLEVPERLEFERFALSLACVDIADASTATTERLLVHADALTDAIRASDARASERSGTLSPRAVRSCIRPGARHRKAPPTSRTSNGLSSFFGARRHAADG